MNTCKYFGTCGGCTSQHISYDLQLEQKKQRLMHITKTDVVAFGSIPFAYRNRMDFIMSPFGIGFRVRGDWRKVVDIENCPISEGPINDALTELRSFFKTCDAFDPVKKSGTFRYAVIRLATSGVALSFVLNQDSTKLDEAAQQIELFAKSPLFTHVAITYVPAKADMSISEEYYMIKGSDSLEQEYFGKKFKYNIQGFFQNNHAGAQDMHKYVSSLLATYDTKKMHLLDLYAGVGTFGIINAHLFSTVVMAESFKGCVDSAQENITNNGVQNAQAICIDAMQLKKIPLKSPLLVITDPPRSGMHPKTIDQLRLLKPHVIIYISCNIEQLEKDLPKFSEYTIKSSALFDLFPQTPHCEAVIELVLK